MLRLKKLINLPITTFNYVKKNPKWNSAKLLAGGYAAYKVFSYAQSDAIAAERIRDHVQQMCQQGSAMVMEGEGINYHMMASKSLLVIVNPAAAGGDTGKYYEQYIEPGLMVSGMDVHVYHTAGVKDARDQAKVLLPNKFAAVVIVGGDGTVSEFISGILQRPDAAEFFESTPLAIIPTGKQNNIYQKNTLDPTDIKTHGGWRHEVADLAVHETKRIVSALNKSQDSNSLLRPVFKVQIRLKGETVEEAREKHQPVFGMDGIEWGLDKNWRSRREDLWMICPAKDFVARSREYTKSTKQTAEFEIQVDKKTVDQVHTIKSRFGDRVSTTREEIFEADGKIDQIYDSMSIRFMPPDENSDSSRLELFNRDVMGEWYDFGMNEDMLRESKGNRFRFHRIVLRNLAGSENIYVDGSSYPMDDIEEMEVTYMPIKIPLLQ